MENSSTIVEDLFDNVLVKSSTDGEYVCGPKYIEGGFLRGEVHVLAIVVMMIFYLLILVTGIVASRLKTGKWKTDNTEDHMVAGRNLGLIIGMFTMTATWVGGGYLNGTAEYVFKPGYGLAWTEAPWGYSVSLILGGIFFAKKMREQNYVTMLDPFEKRYGRVMAALCYIPALLGDVFWSGAILSALGTTLTVIIGLSTFWAVILSTLFAVCYTLIGGLYSVVYTDVIQLVCILVGLCVSIPYAMNHDAVVSISSTSSGENGWLGTFPVDQNLGRWIDTALLLMFGGIPWQVYFQRVLSQKTPARAQVLSFVAGFGCILMAAPAVLIGAIAKSTDWNATGYRESGCLPMKTEDYKMILPLVLHYLTPYPVALIGLGAISAAVMSSADSSILSSSSMFARNIYVPLSNAIRGTCGDKTSERETLWVLRIAILFVAAFACFMALIVDSVYGLFKLCGDLVYVSLFPQLLLVVYMKDANTYGSLAGYILGLAFRFTGREPLIQLAPLIEYPWFVPGEHGKVGYQNFPFKTMCMLITLVTIIIVSYLAKFLFNVCHLSLQWDVFKCFTKENEYEKKLVSLKDIDKISDVSEQL